MARFIGAVVFCLVLAGTASAAPVYHASDNGALLTLSGDQLSVSMHVNGQILAGSGKVTKDFAEVRLFPVSSSISSKAEQSGTGENNSTGSDEDSDSDSDSNKSVNWKASFIFSNGLAQGVIEQGNGVSQVFDAKLTDTSIRRKAEQSGTGE